MATQKAIKTTYEDGTVVWSNLRNKKGIPILSENESYSATKVTTWHDGTPMTDEKADGLVWFKEKESGEFFRANLPNWGETFLEKDTMAQMRGLSPVEILLLKAGYYKGVGLSGYYQKGDTPGRIEYYLSDTASVDDGGSVIEVGGVKLEHKFTGLVDVRYFGVFLSSVTSNRIQEMLDLGFVNLFFPERSEYKFESKLILPDNTIIQSDSNETYLSFNSQDIIELGSNNHIRNISIKGIGHTSTINNAFGIKGVGSSSLYKDTLSLENVKIEGMPFYGVWLEYVSNVNINNLKITGVGYAGFIGYSVSDVTIQNSLVDDVTGVGALAYGFAFTRRANTNSLIDYPRSVNCSIINTEVKNNPTWEAFDTHAGDNIKFINCRSYNCRVGVAIVPSQLSGVDDRAPINCLVSGGYFHCTNLDPAISISGATAASISDVPKEYAENIVVTGNITINGGSTTNNNGGNLRLLATKNAMVSGNSFFNCGSFGVNIYTRNIGFNISSNTVLNAFSDTHSFVSGIAVRGDYNDGTLSSNTLIKDDTVVVSNNLLYGIRIESSLSNCNIQIASGYTNSATPLFGASGQNYSFLRMGNNAKLYKGTTEPNSAIVATVGSLYISENGSTEYPIYVKKAGSGNTGWQGIQTALSGNTAGRPTPSLAKEYFDTTLGRPIWGNGTDWVDVGRNASTTQKGLVNQAAALANISQSDLVAVSSADTIADVASTATDVAGVVTDLNDLISKYNDMVTLVNELKDKYNTQNVPLTNANKDSQNTELDNQRTAGQQSET